MELTGDVLVEYKKILIKTLEAFKLFCKENNLTYFACGGTAIGAVRHNGIIPWDDDIDVCMLRQDYDRMLSLRDKLSDTGYEIAYHDNYENYPIPFAKFMDSNTSIWESKNIPFVEGVFVDIFPLDTVDGLTDFTRKNQKNYIKYYQDYLASFMTYFLNDLFGFIKGGRLGLIKSWMLGFCVKRFLKKRYYNKFIHLDNDIRHINGDFLLNYYTPYKLEKEVFPKEWFDHVVEFPFETTTIMLPSGYHNYLTQLFGNYMELPPVENRISHHYHYYFNLKKRESLKEIQSKLNG